MKAINISEKLSLFSDLWSPKHIAELNGQQILLAKVKGSFVWHQHEDEDELFFVLKGQLKIHFKSETIVLNPGELFVVPKGVAHKPEAENEVHLMLFEPLNIKHTGNVVVDYTVDTFEKI